MKQRTDTFRPALAWFCLFTVIWSACLLYAGGFTTSIEAGMAFLDWPLSNGSLNPDGWLTESDKRAEHSHRLLGATLGLLTVIVAVWVQMTDARKSARRLAWLAVGLTVFQGVLGGLRVLYDRLNTGTDHNLAAQTFRVLHACTAQVFLCVLVSIAITQSRRWTSGRTQTALPPPGLSRAGLIACGAVFIQLVLGAVMRHNHAALAVPYFPHASHDGSWLPPVWDFRIGIHFVHRAWAVVVALALVAFAARLWRARKSSPAHGAGAAVLTAMLALQIWLGALTVWTFRNPHAATLHMLTGAFLLAAAWAETFSLRLEQRTTPAPGLPRSTEDQAAPQLNVPLHS